jgi:hypothetical protein
MKKELTKWAVCVFAALFSFSGSSENLRAQAVNGTLLGTVTDSGGAVVRRRQCYHHRSEHQSQPLNEH